MSGIPKHALRRRPLSSTGQEPFRKQPFFIDCLTPQTRRIPYIAGYI